MRHSSSSASSPYDGAAHAAPSAPYSQSSRIDGKLSRVEARREEDRRDGLEASKQWGAARPAGGSAAAQGERASEAGSKDAAFARYATDRALNERLRGETRWDDPARHFVASLQKARPKFRAPPNRFDIAPGPHWDGINRSNGFEQRLFQRQASRAAVRELSHQYDVEDL